MLDDCFGTLTSDQRKEGEDTIENFNKILNENNLSMENPFDEKITVILLEIKLTWNCIFNVV